MNISSRVVAFLLSALLTCPLAAAAQTAGATVLVEARDTAGAPLAGVLVKLATADTGLERAGVTVDDGWRVCRRAPTR